jgi:outer membrane protein TolC
VTPEKDGDLRSRLDMRPATRHLRGWVLAASVVTASVGVTHVRAAEPDLQRPLARVIDEYVREGLRSNLALRAQTLEVERSAAALDQARARYFPEAALAARV